MSGILSMFWQSVLQLPDRVVHRGSLVVAPASVTIAGDKIDGDERTIQPTQIQVLWSWDGAYPDFNLFFGQIRGGAGTLDLHWLVDKPLNGSTDTTASGTAKRWQHLVVKPHSVIPFGTSETRVHTTLATATGSYTDSAIGELPLLYQDANSADGYVYRICVANRGADPVRFEWGAYR